MEASKMRDINRLKILLWQKRRRQTNGCVSNWELILQLFQNGAQIHRSLVWKWF